MAALRIPSTGIRNQIEVRKLRSSTLSLREKEVLRLIAEGMSNREIGETLKISVRTVEAHRGRVMSS
jgi:DNA-binding CsgD family transcriptional regulator